VGKIHIIFKIVFIVLTIVIIYTSMVADDGLVPAQVSNKCTSTGKTFLFSAL
jgi:hypothetical protein